MMPDYFTDKDGEVHPIRGTPEYKASEDRKRKGTWHQKDYTSDKVRAAKAKEDEARAWLNDPKKGRKSQALNRQYSEILNSRTRELRQAEREEEEHYKNTRKRRSI